MQRAVIGIVIVIAGACGFEDEDKFRTTAQYKETSFAILNAEGELGMLRTGTSVNVELGAGLKLSPLTLYQIVVRNLSTGRELSRSDVLTDPQGLLALTTVAHDLGEYDDVKDEHTLAMSIEQDPTGRGRSMVISEVELLVVPHLVKVQGHGITIEEIQPPHLFSARSDGVPANAFVVGAIPEPAEIGAPIYVAGRDFPRGTKAVDLYLAKDRDHWQQGRFPQRGEEGWIVGPVVGEVVDGVLRPTPLPWQPLRADIGPYDVLVDVDRDGFFDYSLSEKDGADGENKVGLTLQLSAAWGRAMRAAEVASISADAAQQAAKAAAAAAAEAEAAGDAPEARAKAAEARDAAEEAETQAQKAVAAASAARSAFDTDIADAAECQRQADIAARAAEIAAKQAQIATAEAANAEAAQKAWEKVANSKITAGHLLVNLAYSSGAHNGKWSNTYESNATVYTYLNPPLAVGAKNKKVVKVLVLHQSFRNFWNNVGVMVPGGPGLGRIPYRDKVAPSAGSTATVPVQRGCANTPPVSILYPDMIPVETANILRYDIIFDYGNDGYYDIGVDWLDVVANRTNGRMVTPAELLALPDDEVYGFKVISRPYGYNSRNQ